MKAKAAVFMGPDKPFDVREFDVVKAPSGYGRSQLIASGVCGTDVHIHRGKLAVGYPAIIGHEFVGKLDSCNEAEAEKYGLKVGDNVIADIAVPCGECLLCKSGDDANCVNMQVTNGGDIGVAPYLYGGYGEVNFTPLTNLIKIPDSVDPVATAAFACPGPTAIHAFSLAEQAGVDIKNIGTVVVQGLGPVGMFAVLYLKQMGVKTVYAVTASKHQHREETALKFGADKVFCLSEQGEEAVLNELKKANGGLGVDLCFEASGAPKAVVQGMDVLRNRGVYLIPGQYSASGGIEIQPQIITFKALHIIGSSQYSMVDVRTYLKFLEDHPDLYSLIKSATNQYPVSSVNDAFDDMKNNKNIKTLLIKG